MMGWRGALFVVAVSLCGSSSGASWWDEARSLYDGAGMPPSYTSNSVWTGKCVASTDHETRVSAAIYFRLDADPGLGDFPVLHWHQSSRDLSAMPLADVSAQFSETYFAYDNHVSTPLFIDNGVRAWTNTFTRRWVDHVPYQEQRLVQDSYGRWYYRTYTRYREERRSLTRNNRVRYRTGRDGQPVWALARLDEKGEATAYCYFNEQKTTAEQRLVAPAGALGVDWFDRAKTAYESASLPSYTAELRESVWAGRCVNRHAPARRKGAANFFHEERDPVLQARFQMVPVEGQDYLSMPLGDLLRVVRNQVSDAYTTVTTESGAQWKNHYRRNGENNLTYRLREKRADGNRVFFLQVTNEWSTTNGVGAIDDYCYFFSERTKGADR